MSSPELPIFFEEDETHEAALRLKLAAMFIGPLSWESSDNEYLYQATPYDEIDYSHLKDMPMRQILESFNIWRVDRYARADINNEVEIRSYTILADSPLSVTEYTLTFDQINNPEEKKLMADFNASREAQIDLGIDKPEVQDYADLDNALLDLEPLAKKAQEDYILARRSMTADEVRWEKMEKYTWLRTPETNKTSDPKWWCISEGGVLYAIRAFSPDEAALTLEEFHGNDLFPVFFVEICPDDEQEGFESRFKGHQVVRLIPFSNVEWPNDPSTLTDEQKAAFDRLKSPEQ